MTTTALAQRPPAAAAPLRVPIVDGSMVARSVTARMLATRPACSVGVAA